MVDDISIILGPPPIREKKEEEEPPLPPEVDTAQKEDIVEAEKERVAEAEMEPKVAPAPKLRGIPHWVYLPIGGLVILGIILFTRPWEGKTPDPEFTKRIGMKFVLIQPGTFMMGSPPDEAGRDDDEMQRQVTITKSFYLQTTEVTQGQWERVMGKNPSYEKDCGDGCPVEAVSWNDVQGFLKKLNQKEGTNKYRLPTEAEWEYACRAGSTTAFCFGDVVRELGEYAWYDGNSEGRTHPVGQKKPNAWGLYDMHGNVWEWCQDWYGDYPSGDVTDPKGPPSGKYRVWRGGSFDYSERGVRCATRNRNLPDHRLRNIRFRVVLPPS